jgi:hypothetical protein
MHKFHGNVLSIRRVWSAAKRQQTSTPKKPFGHFTAGLSQPASFDSEKRLQDAIARQQSLLNLCR